MLLDNPRDRVKGSSREIDGEIELRDPHLAGEKCGICRLKFAIPASQLYVQESIECQCLLSAPLAYGEVLYIMGRNRV